MGLKETILGWIRGTPDKSDTLEDAENDAATKEYSEERMDKAVDERFGPSPEFEGDQDAPRR